MRNAGIVCLVFLTLAVIDAAAAGQEIVLPSGKKVVLENITVMDPAGETAPRTVQASLSNASDEKLPREQQAVFADEFFMRYFGPYAEKKKFTAAAISFAGKLTAGPFSFSLSRDFRYERRENGVWEPAHDSQLDDKPLSPVREVTLPSGVRIHVEFAGQDYLQPVQRRGWASSYWSRISFETDPEAVYARSRDYWNSVKEQIDPSVKVAGIFAFDQPRLGFYHFRKHMYLIMQTNEKGEWEDLPATLEEVMGGKSRQVQASFGPEGLTTVWPGR